MSHNIIIGRYYPIQSMWHSLNPISKIISTFIFLLLILIINNIWSFLLLFVFVMYIILTSKIPIIFALRGIISLKYLIIIVFIFDYIFTKDILLAIVTIERIILIVMYTSILMLTTKPNDITYALEQIFKPLERFNIPIHDIALSISLAIQFIPNIMEQALKILKSQASRGIDFQYVNLKGKLLALSTMITPLFILSFKRANDLAEAMEIRLYGYDKQRSYYRLNRWTTNDNNIVVLHMGLLIILVLSEVIV